ncbi:hypothetical protein QUB37_13135 [Microcoleus sp. AT3-A2]|uniref:hypothetical protein n=1 Tax=unclassified Microcoleus TaxID=2642155 RepID=UPI002FCEC183
MISTSISKLPTYQSYIFDIDRCINVAIVLHLAVRTTDNLRASESSPACGMEIGSPPSLLRFQK